MAKKVTTSRETLGILEAAHFPLGCVLLLPIYQVAPKSASFERGPEKEKAPQQIQATVQFALQPGP
jgi:hypothetical protein